MMTAKKNLFICNLKRLIILSLSVLAGWVIYPTVTAEYAIETHLVWGLLPMAGIIGIFVARDSKAR